jgi:alkylation response protein AidB-like acyl-CoA dehydrogenase
VPALAHRRRLAAALARDIDAARSALDAASPEYLPAARAAASDLALRATATLMTAVGARGILAGGTAQRLFREAGFLPRVRLPPPDPRRPPAPPHPHP